MRLFIATSNSIFTPKNVNIVTEHMIALDEDEEISGSVFDIPSFFRVTEEDRFEWKSVD